MSELLLQAWPPTQVWAALLTLVCSLGAFRVLSRHTRAPGVSALQVVAGCLLLWGCATLSQPFIGAPELSAQLVLPGQLLLPLAWLAFAIAYARQVQRMATRPLLLLAAPVLMLLPLIWVPALQGWLWVDGAGSGALGPLLMLAHAYGAAQLVAAAAILSFVLTTSHSYRLPLAVLAGWTALALMLLIGTIQGWPGLPGLSAALLAGTLLPAIMLVLRGGFLNLRPMVRSQVFSQLPDGVIIVDAKGRLLDANPKAQDSLLRTPGNPHRQLLSELIPSSVIHELVSGRLQSGELTLGDRAYHVNAASLDEQRSGHRQVLVFRDITDRRNAEVKLRNVQQELERMAHQDPLTGLFNRRVFVSRLAEESERVRRHGNPLSVLLFDLDHFKRVNDRYGHDVGDRVLQAVAQATTGIRRITDVPARIGGEEFALLLPETDKDGALQIAQRLRLAIADLRIPHAGGELTITTSVGVATLTSMSYTEDTLLNDADKALYRAKHAGRNMVCLSD